MRDYITVYEHSVSGSDIFAIIPLLIFIGFGLLLIFYTKKIYRKPTIFRQLVLFFGWIFSIVASIMLIVFLIKLPTGLKAEKELKSMIENELYSTIEGEVVDFSPPNDNNDFESFYVKGIKFSYSDFVLIDGFHKTSRNNGPIKRNGQIVRIGYTKIDDKNVILKLELLNN